MPGSTIHVDRLDALAYKLVYSLPQQAFLVGLCLHTAVCYLSSAGVQVAPPPRPAVPIRRLSTRHRRRTSAPPIS